MLLTEKIANTIRRKQLFTTTDELMLAVSGGIDSVVMTDILSELGYSFTILHCNFKLRGEESERDRLFVESLAKRYQCKILVKEFDTKKFAEENKLSIQEAARELRYDWFAKLSRSIPEEKGTQGKAFLLTAHHADDNIETLLMNFFRGTGIRGMTGIPMKNDYIRRPMLEVTREEIQAWANEHDLTWVEDSSNNSDHYTRNVARQEWLPLLEKTFPGIRQSLKATTERFAGIRELYEMSVSALMNKLVKVKGDELHIPVRQLLSYRNKALIYELIMPWGFTEKQVDEVIKLTEGQSGNYLLSPNADHRILLHRNWLIISATEKQRPSIITIGEDETHVMFEGGSLSFAYQENKKAELNGVLPNQAFIHESMVKYPLLLRKWKNGDYFYPFGMKKKKKLARFFIDQKLSLADKEKIWVIESEQRILWVVGLRMDERCRVTNSAKRILRLQYSPAQ